MSLFGPKRDVSCKQCSKRLARGTPQTGEEQLLRGWQNGTLALECSQCGSLLCLLCVLQKHVLDGHPGFDDLADLLLGSRLNKDKILAEALRLALDGKAACPACDGKAVGRPVR